MPTNLAEYKSQGLKCSAGLPALGLREDENVKDYALLDHGSDILGSRSGEITKRVAANPPGFMTI